MTMTRRALVAALFFLMLAFTAYAQPADTAEKKQKELINVKQKIQNQKIVITKEKQEEQITFQHIQGLEKNLDITRKEMSVFENNIKVVELSIKDLDEKIRLNEKLKAEKEEEVKKVLRDQYKKEGNKYIMLLSKSGNFSEFIERYKFMKILSKKNVELIETYAQLIDDLQQSKKQVQDYRNELAGIKQQKEKEHKKYLNQSWEKHVFLKKIKQDIKKRERALTELEKSAKGLETLLDGMEKTAMEREFISKGTDEVFKKYRKRLPWPVDSSNIIVNFGKYRHPQFKSIVYNRGIDIAAPYGSPVYSIFKGVIKYADWFEGFGKMVIIHHGSGYYTIYGHMSDISVKEGELVDTGSEIGKVGDTESFYGNELYLEIRRGSEPVNPLLYLKRR